MYLDDIGGIVMEKTREFTTYSFKNKSLDDLLIKVEVGFIFITLIGFFKLLNH